jgi:hypothetical protein
MTTMSPSLTPPRRQSGDERQHVVSPREQQAPTAPTLAARPEHDGPVSANQRPAVAGRNKSKQVHDDEYGAGV